MKKLLTSLGTFYAFCTLNYVEAHCQMPCGIYHDSMVYDQIDQYVETMYKGQTVINDNKFANAHDRNEFVRWILTKDKSSDDMAQLITTYFLQQKIKPGEDDTDKKLKAAHKLLFLIVAIKQNSDRSIVEQFADEWEKFKLMFHVEGYECQIEMLKQRKRQAALKEAENNGDKQKAPAAIPHEHDHDHPHDH